MMGDYVEYSLLEAARHGFDKVHLCAQWAKMLKIAMATPQTHVSHGVIDLARAAAFLGDLGFPGLKGREFTTAREMFELIAATAGRRLAGRFFACLRRGKALRRIDYPRGPGIGLPRFLQRGGHRANMAKLTIIGIGGRPLDARARPGRHVCPDHRRPPAALRALRRVCRVAGGAGEDQADRYPRRDDRRLFAKASLGERSASSSSRRGTRSSSA